MAKAKAKRRAKRGSAPVGPDRIMMVLNESPGAKTSDLAERLGVAQLQIRNELMQLEQSGMVHRTGQTRGTRWYPGTGSGEAAHEEELPPEAGESAERRGPKERILDDNRDLLGSLPDSEAAKRTGVSVRTIAAYRKKHGIAGYSGPRRRGGKAEAPAAAAAPAAPTAPARRAPKSAATNGSSGNAAWRVDIRVGGENVVRYVFAPSLEDAARTATAGASSLGGQVIGIGWVGDALA